MCKVCFLANKPAAVEVVPQSTNVDAVGDRNTCLTGDDAHPRTSDQGGGDSAGSGYHAMLSIVDGMPGLVPFPPSWPHSAEMRTSLYSKLGTNPKMMEMCISAGINQRVMDARWRHFLHLLKQHDDGSVRAAREWEGLLCTASGWDGSALRHGPDCTVSPARCCPILFTRQ